ncbi:MAG: VWA domain-containing protein [Deltaproteobacteria bacterium]|nr:VWA domain-containing protein [Deltaproteobacteria bacterium]
MEESFGIERLAEFVPKGHLVLLLDLSSSMQRVARIVPALNAFMRRIPESSLASLVTFNRDVQVVQQYASPRLLPRFEGDRWHTGIGGHLAGGSQICRALSVAIPLATKTQEQGIPTGILLLSDGWSRGDAEYAPLARAGLTMVRKRDIRFGFFAFVSSEVRQQMEDLVATLQLREGEVHISYYEGNDDHERSAEGSVNAMETQHSIWVDTGFGRPRRE